ncbi:MAG TPA: alpha/beta hydrolase [Burkholderiales bacterium]|jgi:pimeloyl-ACP methyl ester carboxylesterase|nr:alpha/beta hydrolase [Burkholderiales bacterium]
MKPGASHFHEIRGLRHHVRTWGDERSPTLFLLHGWMDVSASFQFVVDALQDDWHVVAPDWRGFGLSTWAPGGYWFPDYYADLDALLDLYQPDTPVNLVGHSMGGNVALMYAGMRPQRVAHVISLEGFGTPRVASDEAPRRYAQWLDELHEPTAWKLYESLDALAARLGRDNPRLSAEQAAFLASHRAEQMSDGSVRLRADPRHRIVNPVLNRIDENFACWQAIDAPVLWVRGADTTARVLATDTPRELAQRKQAFRNLREETIPDCGHMMHFDQPVKLARVIEEFMRAQR